MFSVKSLPLNDAKIIQLPHFDDARGAFIKTFHNGILQENNIDFSLMESYYSFSKKGVIRGMHFQEPPHDHAKIVFCPYGSILDVIVDLRKSSLTFGQHYGTVLSDENNLAYYIPKGFAHGFKALTENAMTYYLVSSEYSKEHDTGIRYDSFGFDWRESNPVISERDLSFPDFDNWESPF